MKRLVAFLVLLALVAGVAYTVGHRTSSTPTTTTLATTTSTTSTTLSTTTSTSSAVPCTSDALTIGLSLTGGGTGTSTFQLIFQNTGNSPCSLLGTSSLQLRDMNGAAMPTITVASTSGFSDAQANLPARSVRLEVGGKALEDASYPSVPAGTQRTCPIAASVDVLVPRTVSPASVQATINPCGGGLIRLSPIFS
ncbi:MAG: DUF4232 domain-containing protein [Actinomycetota bacterium]